MLWIVILTAVLTVVVLVATKGAWWAWLGIPVTAFFAALNWHWPWWAFVLIIGAGLLWLLYQLFGAGWWLWLAAFALIVGSIVWWSSNRSEETLSSVSSPEATAQDVVEALYVPNDVPNLCVDYQDQNGVVPFEIQSQRPELMWSDSVGPALPTDNPLAEIQRRICSDPWYAGQQLGDYFANKEIGGVKLVEINPWLAKWQGGMNATYTAASSFVPLLGVTNPTKEQVETAVAQNLQWQQEASRFIMLLGKYSEFARDARVSSFNYHLAGAGLQAGGPATIGLNPEQESREALWLKLTTKTQDCVEVVGFNIGDGRFEGTECSTSFVEPAPVESAPPVVVTETAPPVPVASSVVTETAPPAPEPQPACPPGMTGEWPVCKDSPANLPENQGNLPEQVQGAPKPVEEPASQPSETQSPEAVYSAPAEPAPSVVETGQVQPAPRTEQPAPAPTSAVAAGDPTPVSGTCNPVDPLCES